MGDWTINEEDQLKSLVGTGISTREISKVLHRSFYGCRSKIYELGLINKYVYKLYSVNESFWKEQSLLNCYWAGFAAADACIYERKNKHFSFLLKLSRKDRAHLEIFKNDCQFSGPVKDNKDGSSIITINSDLWATDLKETFGLTPNKTKRMGVPNFKEDIYKFAWIIGYLDGDGSIKCNRARESIQICFVSSSSPIIEFLKETFDCLFPNKRLSKISHKLNYHYYEIGGERAADILSFLSKIEVPKLKRKWNNQLLLDRIGNKIMKKTKKLDSLKETNAKIEKFKPTTLDAIWGGTGTSKYGTNNLEEYEAKLKGMNQTDLHAHARSLGIMPDSNFSLLMRKLRQAFLEHTNGYKIPSTPPQKPIKVSPAVEKVLSEGR